MKFKKKPVTIDAIQWNGENTEDVLKFLGESLNVNVDADGFKINTLEGTMTASVGDFIIKGVKGEFYPCKPDIFEQTYELEQKCENNIARNSANNLMNFGQALIELQNGKKLCRKGWNGKGIYIELQVPDENSKMTLPYIYIVTSSLVTDNPDAPKGIVPWLASQTDLLANDWQIKDGE